MIPAFQNKPAKSLNYFEKRRASLIAFKPRKRIKAVSSKRAREGVEYARLKREFLLAHPVCQFPGCTCRELDIHHKARRGLFLLRVDTWMAICRHHHERIEQNPAWAKENGYLLTPAQRRAIA